ncbi:hypothetical protein LCGC14_3152000, partial [marine sediment metagenome]
HSPEDRDEIYRRFITYVEEWRIRLVLREWAIDFHLRTEGTMSGATTICSPKYHEVDILLRLPDDVETCWADEELEESAVHELMHVLMSTWDVVWQKTHKKPLRSQMLNMLLISEEQLCTRLALGFMRTKYPRRKAHSSSSGEQSQVSSRRRQSSQ